MPSEGFRRSRHALINSYPITRLNFLERLFQAIGFNRMSKPTNRIIQETFLYGALPTLSEKTIPIPHVPFVMTVTLIVLLHQRGKVVPQ